MVKGCNTSLLSLAKKRVVPTCRPDVFLYPNAISTQESYSLAFDFQSKLDWKEYDENGKDQPHWKNARDAEISYLRWSKPSIPVIHRLFQLTFDSVSFRPKGHASPHILDLEANHGCILPHDDSKFHSGDVFALLSLLSTRRFQLLQPVENSDDQLVMELELEPLSLLVVAEDARKYLHSIDYGPERWVGIRFRDE